MNVSTKKMVKSGLILTFSISLLLVGCYASPTNDDVTRVKKHFLSLRFQSGLDAQMQNKSDMELFKESCMANRVRCDDVLKMLKKSDPKFFKALNDEEGNK